MRAKRHWRRTRLASAATPVPPVSTWRGVAHGAPRRPRCSGRSDPARQHERDDTRDDDTHAGDQGPPSEVISERVILGFERAGTPPPGNAKHASAKTPTLAGNALSHGATYRPVETGPRRNVADAASGDRPDRHPEHDWRPPTLRAMAKTRPQRGAALRRLGPRWKLRNANADPRNTDADQRQGKWDVQAGRELREERRWEAREQQHEAEDQPDMVGFPHRTDRLRDYRALRRSPGPGRQGDPRRPRRNPRLRAARTPW